MNHQLMHQISDSKKQQGDFLHNRNKLCVDNLVSLFPDGGLLTTFSILDPNYLPSIIENLSSYGNAEIETLAQHYGVSKQTEME